MYVYLRILCVDLCMYVYLRILRSKKEMSSLVIFMIRLPLSDIKKYFNFTISHVSIFHQSLSGKDYFNTIPKF